MANHYYKASNKSFMKLGLKKRKLSISFLKENILQIINYKNLVDQKTINPSINWKNK